MTNAYLVLSFGLKELFNTEPTISVGSVEDNFTRQPMGINGGENIFLDPT